MAMLDLARGVFSTSSVAHEECAGSAKRSRLDGDKSRLDISFDTCSLHNLLRFLLVLNDGGGEGACESQEHTELMWVPSEDGRDRIASSQSHEAMGIARQT